MKHLNSFRLFEGVTNDLISEIKEIRLENQYLKLKVDNNLENTIISKSLNRP